MERRAAWFPDYLADLDALLEHYSPNEPARIVGHSMGAIVASLRRHPARAHIAFSQSEGFGLLGSASPGETPTVSTPGSQIRDDNSVSPLRTALAGPAAATVGERAAHRWNTAPHWPVDDGFTLLPSDRRPAAIWLINPAVIRYDEARGCWRRVTRPDAALVAGSAIPVMMARRPPNSTTTAHRRAWRKYAKCFLIESTTAGTTKTETSRPAVSVVRSSPAWVEFCVRAISLVFPPTGRSARSLVARELGQAGYRRRPASMRIAWRPCCRALNDPFEQALHHVYRAGGRRCSVRPLTDHATSACAECLPAEFEETPSVSISA